MRAVALYRRRPEDAVTELVAVVQVARPGEPAVVVPMIAELAEGLSHIMAEGISDGRGRALGLKDGEAFLDALPDYYRGSRFWAEERDAG